MHNFNYKYIKLKYYGSSNLLFADTDSLFYEIETDKVYQDFYKEKSFLCLIIILNI